MKSGKRDVPRLNASDYATPHKVVMLIILAVQSNHRQNYSLDSKYWNKIVDTFGSQSGLT
jgi:hypothetical protein